MTQTDRDRLVTLKKSHRQEDNPEANRCGAKGKRAPDKADAFQTEAAG